MEPLKTEIITDHAGAEWRKQHEEKRALEYKDKVTKEVEQLVNRWERTSLLQGIADEYAQGQMAMLLENQRLINEISTDSGDMCQFKRISIPLVRRVYDPRCFIGWDLVSIQAMIGPTAFGYFDKDGIGFEEIAAYTKRIKCLWEFPTHDDIRKQHDLDKEAEKTAVMASEICDEFNQEIIEDLRNNCGFVEHVDWSTPEALWEAVVSLFDGFEKGDELLEHKGFGKKPNWIVTGTALAKDLKKVAKFEERSDISYICSNRRTGTLDKITLIECEHLLPNDILVGYKDGIYGSGYVFAPYVPFTRTPVMLDPDTFHPRAGILTRYGKRLFVGGSKFYARLRVKGHPAYVEPKEESVEILDIGKNVEKSE